MLCELYKQALSQAAASRAGLPREVSAHISICAACSAAFAQEQALFASIDNRLGEVANAELPRHFLANTLDQLAEEPTPQSRWIFAAVPVSVIATVVFVLALGFSILGHKRIVNHTSVDKAATVPDQRTIAVLSAVPVLKITGNRPRYGRYLKSVPARTAPSAEPEVLVPPEEREAFARFLAALNADQDVAVALVRPLTARPEEKEQPVQLPDLQIAQLFVPPLVQQDERQNEK
jgi:hypothetical protein